MPSIVTHHLFAEDVLNKKEQLNIEENIYYIFAQSFDNLFYYKFLTPWQGKKIREFGNSAQKEKVNLYFQNIIEYIENTNNQNNPILLSYLYGSICHYVLDRTCHPYIIYCTGMPEINKKYRGLHEKMEVNIDAYLLKQKKNKKLKDEKLANILISKEKFNKDLITALDTCFYKTFKKSNIGSIYQSSIITGNLLLKYFVTDKTGLKKLLYVLKDLLTFWSNRKYQYLSFHVTKINEDYLNKNHELWYYPVDSEINYNKSFLELYEEALETCVHIINQIENYFNHLIPKEELLKIIGNLSYTTGIDCTLKKEMKYFKF